MKYSLILPYQAIIEIKYHYVDETITNGHVSLEYCPTEKMVSDLLIEPLASQRFAKLCKAIRLTSVATNN